MSTENDELHGNAPDTCGVALLLIDVINDFEYPGGDQLFAQALPAAQRIAALKATASRTTSPLSTSTTTSANGAPTGMSLSGTV